MHNHSTILLVTSPVHAHIYNIQCEENSYAKMDECPTDTLR